MPHPDEFIVPQLAATLEEIQKHFDPHWFHEVLFLRTNRPPTLPQLSQLMNSVAKVTLFSFSFLFLFLSLAFL